MIDCTKELFEFYTGEVRLKKPQREELRQHRAACQARLKTNLGKNGDPTPVEHIKQGGYSMRTTTQQLPEKDYDIDDGCVFEAKDLKGERGADKSALEARRMVHNASKDAAFNKEPELLKNCVRVHYAAGHHVDVPVYRRHTEESGETWYELASSDWKKSDPQAVTTWFQEENRRLSPDENHGRQLRRVVCLLKRWRRKNRSWNMPSGLVVSKLVAERFAGYLDRDDESLYRTLQAIHTRLCGSLAVDHPVSDSQVAGAEDARTRNMREELGKALVDLRVLDSSACTKAQGLEAWKKFFGTDFFDETIEQEKAKEAERARAALECLPARPAPWSAEEA